mmetsp:Transcript_30454/g.70223  ORF Transcript_30454/g.70223 Transcript_30454/m.70223 type:complete len:161 (+) Transcript_30454:4259-4741(+)
MIPMIIVMTFIVIAFIMVSFVVSFVVVAFVAFVGIMITMVLVVVIMVAAMVIMLVPISVIVIMIIVVFMDIHIGCWFPFWSSVRVVVGGRRSDIELRFVLFGVVVIRSNALYNVSDSFLFPPRHILHRRVIFRKWRFVNVMNLCLHKCEYNREYNYRICN